MKKYSAVLVLIMLFVLFGCGCSGSQSSAPVSSTGGVSEVDSSSVPLQESNSVPVPVFASESMSASQLPMSQIPSSQPATNIESRAIPENVDEAYLTGLGDLSGVVTEVRLDGFLLEGGAPQTSANGQYAALVTELEAEIAYTGETIFLYAEYERSTDKSTCYMGGVEDVAQGRSVTVWGEYEGDSFVATAVRVVVFV